MYKYTFSYGDFHTDDIQQPQAFTAACEFTDMDAGHQHAIM